MIIQPVRDGEGGLRYSKPGWWHMLVVPGTCETEAGGWLEPKSSRPAWETQ